MLDKAIQHKKEYRKQYRRSAAFDRSCRNGGSCSYCRDNRTYNNRRRELIVKDKLKEYVDVA
jgi:hypothetical protein